MVRMRSLILGGVCLIGAPALSPAQAAQTPLQPPKTLAASTTDFVSLHAVGPGVPLKFGSIVPDSEKVMLDGVPLQRGQDYSIDYQAGVVYLMRAQRAGQSLVVNYSYDPLKTQVPAQPFLGMNGFKFDLAPGRLGMMMGLGLAERTDDGQVLMSNILGMNTNFGFAGGGLKGLMLVGAKQKADVQSSSDYLNPQTTPVEDGTSSLIVQNLQTKMSGGTVKLDYQDVGTHFTGFSQAVSAGYDQKTVDQLAKEKGLKRLGVSMEGMKFGSMSLTDGFKTVGDSDSSITWKNFGFAQGGLSVNWQSRTVDKTFTRFNDLAESDRAQLQNEVGMVRDSISGKYASKFATLNFTSNRIQDENGHAIEKREYSLDGGKFKFNMGDQSVDAGFTRFGNLMDADRDQWGREVGLSRQWMGFEASLPGNAPLKFSQSLVHGDQGDRLSRDLSYVGKTWSLQHDERNVGRGFTALGNMPGAELNEDAKVIAQMYGGPNAGYTPDDRNQLLNSPGIDRKYTRLEAHPFHDLNFSLDNVTLRGATDGAQLTTFNLQGKTGGMFVRHMSLGRNFSEVTSLMNLERARLGTLLGVDRTDFGFNMSLKGGDKLTVAGTKIGTQTGGADRETAEFSSKKLDIAVASRAVDSGFTQVGQILDPEAPLLNSIQGLRQSEAKIKWQLLPNMKVDALFSNAGGMDLLNQSQLVRNLAMAWAPDKKSSIDYIHQELRTDEPTSVLFANALDQMTLSRDLGRFGRLRLVDIRQQYDGLQATVPGFSKQVLDFETKLNTKTTLSTQQSRTQFDDGAKEDVSSNTISTSISKTTGVSVTDTAVDRDGVDRDERKRNYGFWYDFGKGMKLSYGYNRQLAGQQAGVLQSNVGVTPGTVGDIKVDAATYNVNEWDAAHTQATSNVSFQTAKPLRIGHITDFKFNVGMDTAADYTNWLRENRIVAASGKYASNTISYLYRGQLDATGQRGIDRGFQFKTDPSDKCKYSMNIGYKVRTLPGDQQFMIRNYEFKARPARNFELTNVVATNPEVAAPTAILGSIVQNTRSNKWKLDYKGNENVTVGGTFDEEISNGALSRLGGLTFTFNAAKGSPFSVFLGGQTTDQGGSRQNLTRYQLRYDQKTGPNQQFSFFAGNVVYQQTVADNGKTSGVTVRLDYQFRF